MWQEVFGSSEAVLPATSKMSQVLRQLRAVQSFLRQTVGLSNFPLLQSQQTRVIETLLGQSSMIATEVANDILAELDECWDGETVAKIKAAVSQRVEVEAPTTGAAAGSRKTMQDFKNFPYLLRADQRTILQSSQPSVADVHSLVTPMLADLGLRSPTEGTCACVWAFGYLAKEARIPDQADFTKEFPEFKTQLRRGLQSKGDQQDWLQSLPQDVTMLPTSLRERIFAKKSAIEPRIDVQKMLCIASQYKKRRYPSSSNIEVGTEKPDDAEAMRRFTTSAASFMQAVAEKMDDPEEGRKTVESNPLPLQDRPGTMVLALEDVKPNPGKCEQASGNSPEKTSAKGDAAVKIEVESVGSELSVNAELRALANQRATGRCESCPATGACSSRS